MLGVVLALGAAEKYIGQDVQVQHCRVLWEPVLATRYIHDYRFVY